MKRVIECIGRVTVNILMLIMALVMVVIFMPIWIIAEIFGNE